MSVVIIGGHDRMVRQYKEICENHKYKAKVFTQMKTGLDKLIGRPDLLILFTNTVSHKMVRCVLDEVDEDRTDIVRCHTSSGTALAEILEKHSAGCSERRYTHERRDLRGSTEAPGERNEEAGCFAVRAASHRDQIIESPERTGRSERGSVPDL